MSLKTPEMVVYITGDGDGIGRMVGQAELKDSKDEIRRISQKIDAGNEIFRAWCERVRGEVIGIGGDEIRIAIDPAHLAELPGICETYESASGATISVGVGMKLSDSAKALLVAKLRGKDRIVMFTPDLAGEIKAAVEAHEKQSVGSKEVEEYLKFEKAEDPAVAEPGDQLQAVAPKDEKSFEDHFHEHASAKAAGVRHESAIKYGIAQALQTVKQLMPQIEELKGQRPEVYQTVVLLSQELISVAHDMFGGAEAAQPKTEGFSPNFQPPPEPEEEQAAEPAPKVQKSEGLAKGSLQRKLPYNPQKAKIAAGPEAVSQMNSWVQGFDGDGGALRDEFPRIEGHERQRALNKLTAATKTRRNHAGEVEFLLHRGMNDLEHKHTVNATHVDNAMGHSSWTPRYQTAKNFGNQYAEMQHPPRTASAWIAEKNIHAIPKQLGDLTMGGLTPGPATHTMEHEVIVAPHYSERAQPGRDFPATKLADLHGRINQAGKDHSMLTGSLTPFERKFPRVEAARVSMLKERMKGVQKAELGLTPPLHPPQLHSTVEGFMSGFKAIPKGTPARGKFITQHMNHGPFLTALKAHPQGAQIHSMLTQHLNSAANAGFKPGATVAVAKHEPREEIDLSKAPETPKEFIGDLGWRKVYLVDGSFIRDYVDIEFTEGGNHGRYDWIPVGEIWLENSHNQMDIAACSLHEFLESDLMQHPHNKSYDAAHDVASGMEKQFREELGENHSVELPQALEWLQSWAKDRKMQLSNGPDDIKKTAAVQSGEAEAVGAQTFELAEAPVSKPMKKKFGLPGSRTRNLTYLPGAIKNGKIKIVEPDTGKPSWKGVRSGMIRSNDNHPISSREPNGK